MSYLLHILIFLGVYAVLVLSLNLVVGYCGLLSLAHASFLAVGSYSYAISNVAYGWSSLWCLVSASLTGAALGLILAIATWRLRGDFFIIGTLAVQALTFASIFNWTDSSSQLGSLQNLTNGPYGISRVPKPSLLGWELESMSELAGFSWLVAAICFAVACLLFRSPWGRLCRAVRDDELAAQSLGKSALRLRAQVLTISGLMAALAGAVYASYVGYVDPSLASLDQSILLLSMVVVGGLSSIRGSVVGAAVLLAVPEALRFLGVPTEIGPEVRLGIYGAMLLLVVHARPQGLAGDYRLE